jgi:hypothetical protein
VTPWWNLHMDSSLAAVPRTDVREDKELSQVDMAGCPQ